MKLFTILGVVLASVSSFAGEWSVLSTSASVTHDGTQPYFITCGGSSIDARTCEASIDLNRSVTNFEAMLGSINGSHTFTVTITSHVRYTAGTGETVTPGWNRLWWENRDKEKVWASTSMPSSTLSIEFPQWPGYYAYQAGVGTDIDGSNLDMYGNPDWEVSIFPYQDFWLYHISGNVYEGTAVSTYYAYDELDWYMEWEPFTPMESFILEVNAFIRQQWRVVKIQGQEFSGF